MNLENCKLDSKQQELVESKLASMASQHIVQQELNRKDTDRHTTTTKHV